MQQVGYLLEKEEDKKYKIHILEFMMKAIRQQISTESILSYIYPGKYLNQKDFQIRFPIKLITDDGLIELSEEIATEIDFSKITTISTPKIPNKFARAIKNIVDRGFEYKKMNVYATYYEYLDICVIENGYHHTSVAILNNNGTIMAGHRYKTHLLFPYIHINDKIQFQTINGEVILQNPDIRLALLYNLAREKWLLERV